jgi:hypothetical protein
MFNHEKESSLSHEWLLSNVKYYPDAGQLWWAKSGRGRNRSKPINGRHAGGYLRIRIFGEFYMQHRVIWFYMTGEWPKDQIDHINGVRDDNRWENLREATAVQNSRNRRASKNNKSGFKGVYLCKQTKKWSACIWLNGKSVNLGRFDWPKEAHEAYCKAAKENHGEFASFD